MILRVGCDSSLHVSFENNLDSGYNLDGGYMIKLRGARECEAAPRDSRVLRRTCAEVAHGAVSFRHDGNILRATWRSRINVAWESNDPQMTLNDCQPAACIAQFVIVRDGTTATFVCWDALFTAVLRSALYVRARRCAIRGAMSRELADIRRAAQRAERAESECEDADSALADLLRRGGVPRVVARGWIHPDPCFA